jgi:tetratricopeptide (TPR) repeat protein
MMFRTVIFALLAAFCVAGGAVAKDMQKLNRIAAIYESGDVAKTITEMKPYLASNPDDDLAWTILGHAYLDAEKKPEAEKAYKEALRINPKMFQAVTGLGMLASASKKYDEAMKWYEQAIKMNPKYAQAYSSIVTIALKRGDFKKAVSMGEKGVQLNKTDPVIASNLAIAYHYDKQIEARDRMAKTAIQLGYKNGDGLKKIFAGELDIRD